VLSALNLSSESDEQEVKHFDEGSLGVQPRDEAPRRRVKDSSRQEVKVAVVKPWRKGRLRRHRE
jgi:hypothetical protein